MRTAHFFLSTFFLFVGLIIMCAGLAGIDDHTLDNNWKMWFLVVVVPGILASFMLSLIIQWHREIDNGRTIP